ncbi:nucleoside-diphosphate sugar epimerase/dehydratase [Spirulina subsalsa]|uniref:nucleoside-diphosphate sugar epimerase/dehydratase n=1 Tax=Spirulina subsalsa TaxID=54311 RepID=UPI0002E2BD54|nr:nucleoside-diphosphate sugar epimerase/dehydratase [Spirulina subsalsa]
MSKRLPSFYRFAQLGLDGFIAGSVCLLAFIIRFEGEIYPPHETIAWLLPLLAIPGRLLIQAGFGLYQQVWRLFGLRDFIRLLNAVSFYSLLVLVITRLLLPRFTPFAGIPLGVAAIDWSFCLMGMVAVRYARRRSIQQPLWRKSRHLVPPKRVLLLGAGMAGSLIVQEVRQNPHLNLQIVGFLDDDPTKMGRRVEGIKVLGRTSQLLAIAQHHQIQEILIAMPSASAEQIRRIVNLTSGTTLKLKILPGQAELLQDRSLTPQARDIQIQDILGRAEIRLDFSQPFNNQFPSASEQIYQRSILVTGAGGTIGSEICRQLARLQPQHLLLLGRGENSIFLIEQELKRTFPHLTTTPIIADIRHKTRLEQVFQTWRPQIVFHAAAHKHVPLMQHNPSEALENNTLASAQLAQLAARFGVQTFVMISTDKAVDPCNFMGLSKRLAELFVKGVTQQISPLPSAKTPPSLEKPFLAPSAPPSISPPPSPLNIQPDVTSTPLSNHRPTPLLHNVSQTDNPSLTENKAVNSGHPTKPESPSPESTANTRFLVVRFGNVLGSRGSVVPIFQAQIARGGPVTVTDAAMTRYFMTTPEASQLVIQSLAVGQSGQTLILDMGTPVRIYDLAEQMIQLAGFTPGEDIAIQITGLRPGEKLHESLICSSEQTGQTEHPKIMAVLGQVPTLAVWEQAIAQLQTALQQNLTPDELWQIAQECQQILEQNSQIAPSGRIEKEKWDYHT